MDYLDPKYERRHRNLLYIGYFLVAIGLYLAVRLLLEISVGYGYKDGQVIQYGTVFVSSAPSGAAISLDDKPTDRTNSRLSIQSGDYSMRLTRDGYRSWQQALHVDGGAIERYDYPLLIPTTLDSTAVTPYDSQPGLVTQSPDQRWILVQRSGSDSQFDQFDLRNPKAAATTVELPTGLLSAGTTVSIQMVEWASDNKHVLLKRTYDTDKIEYIMMNRDDPTQSINLSQQLDSTPTEIDLRDRKFDQYYLYDATAQTLSTASLSQPAAVQILTNVLAFKSYGSDQLLYVSSLATPSGKVTVNLLQGGDTFTIRTLAANTTYRLDFTKYDGSWIVAAGAGSENKVYVYKNPVSQLSNNTTGVAVPIAVLKVTNPNYLSFSSSARFVMTENSTSFAVYDVENDETHTYDAKSTLDAPQTHASWLDSSHLQYVSDGKLVIFDFNHGNAQTLMAANPAFLPAYSPDYQTIYSIGTSDKSDDKPFALNSTSLRTPADR